MNESTQQPTLEDPERTLEREIQLVRQAIAVVAGGASSRVTVAGLHFGDDLLETARDWAAAAGVRLVPLWRTDESGVDFAVEAGGTDR